MNNKSYKWNLSSRDICSNCKEGECETEFTYEGSNRKILVRDCQPATRFRLPQYLRKEMEA